jgi:hypothetical protein
MSGQKFIARESTRRVELNGAVSFGPGGPFDCLGNWAKIQNCPIHGTEFRRTCYATAYADTHFSIPAVCTVRGKRVVGYLTGTETGPEFRAMDSHKHLLS